MPTEGASEEIHETGGQFPTGHSSALTSSLRLSDLKSPGAGYIASALFAGLASDPDDAADRLAVLREHAQSRGLRATGEYADVENPQGGPQFLGSRRLRADASHGRFRLVLVSSLSSLGPSVRCVLEFVGEVGRLGLDLVACNGAIDTRRDDGKSLFADASRFAEVDHIIRSSRASLGLARAKAQGKRIGARRIPIDMDKARDLRAKGMSWRRLGLELRVGWQTVRRRLLEEGRSR